jgi:hypothetical protein
MSVLFKILCDPNDKSIEILKQEFKSDPEAEKKFYEALKNLANTVFDIRDNIKA